MAIRPSLGWRWITSLHRSAVAGRFVAIGGVVWAAIQVLDRFKVSPIPEGWTGIAIMLFITLFAVQGVEIALLRRRAVNDEEESSKSPEEAFAEGLLRYARELSSETARRDEAVLELRSWSSRTLHLMGAHAARVELGMIALASATAIKDDIAEASILIDELGWSMYRAGREDEALQNLAEALEVIAVAESLHPTPELRELRAKATRHIANIRGPRADQPERDRLVNAARMAANGLEEPTRALHLAQVDHTEASLLLNELDRGLGENGKVDPSGDLARVLDRALVLTDAADKAFCDAGDRERELKVAQLRVSLLRHHHQAIRLTAATHRLKRLELEAARKVHLQ